MSANKLHQFLLVLALLIAVSIPLSLQSTDPLQPEQVKNADISDIPAELSSLEVKGRAPKTGYERSQFGSGWGNIDGCDTRNVILVRDLEQTVVDKNCKVISGILNDPYTGTTLQFTRGETTSDDVQIDHVVALSDAWQKGAQQLSYATRASFANDPLNLLAVDGQANQQKSDGDAATWLPPNKTFRCQYVKQQISVKQKYSLWVTSAERDAIAQILGACTETNS